MDLKSTWKLFLTIAFSIMMISCHKPEKEYLVIGEFRYLNATDEIVSIKIVYGFNQVLPFYSILPHDTLIITTSGETGSKLADPLDYRPGISGDTTTIVFRDTLCYREYHQAGPILQNIKSYSWQKRSDRDYVFFFKIDSSLLNKATKCN